MNTQIPIHLYQHFHNLTEQERLEFIYADPLTGLYNRRAFNLDPREWMLLFDMDSFKWINDTFGHRVGDCALREFADELVDHFDYVNCYRLSGDELVVKLLPQYADSHTMWRHIRQLRIPFPNFSVGLGRGIAEADQNLRHNKQSRKRAKFRTDRGKTPPWAQSYYDRFQPLAQDSRTRDQ